MIGKFLKTIFVTLAVFSFVTPTVAFAARKDSFSLSPLIVDEKAKKRDILKQTAVLTNNTERKVTIYTSVRNLDKVEGDQKFEHYNKAEIETSLANWIEIKRSVIELEPGETKRVPYLIQVHLNAIPGLYHAKIYFQEGSNRGEAESRIKTWHAIDINLEILDDAREKLQLSSFSSDKIFFTGKTASFSFLLENIGNRAVEPRGEVRIFNRRGEEVAALPANQDGTSLLPEATSMLGTAWEAVGKFGRYKAMLDVEYGNKQMGTINDTVFFWVVPWKQLLLLFVGLAVVVVIAGYMAYDKYGFNKREPAVAYAEYDTQPQMQNMAAQQTHISAQVMQPVARAQVIQPIQKPPQPKETKVVRQTNTRLQYVGQATKLQPRQKPPQPQQQPGAVISLKKKS